MHLVVNAIIMSVSASVDFIGDIQGSMLQKKMIRKCNTEPFGHVFEGGSVHPFNQLSGRGDFPWGHLCLCGEKAWEGHNPQTDGLEEIEPFIKHQRVIIKKHKDIK